MDHVGPVIRKIIYIDLGHEETPPQSFVDVARLAESVGASLTLWHAPTDTDKRRRTPRPGRPRNRRRLDDVRVSATEDRFSIWMSGLHPDVRTNSVVASGRWTTEIATELRTGSYDLVVVAGVNDKLAIRRIRHLVRTCDRPLLVVFRSLVDGVVAEVHADDPLDLNSRVIRTAAAVAHGMGTRAIFVCPTTPDAAPDRIEEIRVRLSELAAECAEIEPGDVTVEVGRPVQVVHDRAVEHDADVVVIGGSGRLGVKSRLLGNSAEHLLQQATRSVLIVDPTAANHPRAIAPSRRAKS